MRVIKPRLLDESDLTSSTILVDSVPEWTPGAVYEVASTFTALPSDYRNLVKKPTFQDGNVGGWAAPASFGCTAKAIKELRVRGVFLEFSQVISVSPGESLYVTFTVNSEFSEIPGKFGVRATSALQYEDTVGVSFLAGKTAQQGFFAGFVTVPAGVTSVNPVIYNPDVVGKSRPRYVAFLNLRVSRSSDLSTNVLTKQNFDDGTVGSVVAALQPYVMDSLSYNSAETAACLTTAVGQLFTEEGNIFPVYPGETLHARFEVKASVGSAAEVGVKFISKSGAVVSYSFVGDRGLSPDSWSTVSGNITVPANAYFAKPAFSLTPGTGTAYANNLYIGRRSYITNGPLVKRTGLNTVYQAVVAGASTVAPELDPNNWVPVMSTNEWAAFDREPETASTALGSLSVTLKLNGADSLALFGVKCDSAVVSVIDSSGSTVYGPKTFGSNPVVLTDLPATVTTNKVIITLTGTGQVSLGLVDIGTAVDLGGTDYGATFTIVDYSRKEVDEFGTASFVKRGFAKKISAKSMFANTDLNRITSTLSELRATPCSWSITDEVGLETMNIFGWYEDLDINIPYPKHSYCSVNIQGLIE